MNLKIDILISLDMRINGFFDRAYESRFIDMVYESKDRYVDLQIWYMNLKIDILISLDISVNGFFDRAYESRFIYGTISLDPNTYL